MGQRRRLPTITRSRNTPSAGFLPLRWQVSRLADTGAAPHDPRLPDPMSQWPWNLSGHGRGGGCLGSFPTCRIPSSPVIDRNQRQPT